MPSLQLTHETFVDFVTESEFVVVHCWAEWNGYDHTMRSVIDSLKPSFAEIEFAELDVDPPEHRSICRSLEVQGPPFLALYQRGELFSTRVGLMERDELRSFLGELISPPSENAS